MVKNTNTNNAPYLSRRTRTMKIVTWVVILGLLGTTAIAIGVTSLFPS